MRSTSMISSCLLAAACLILTPVVAGANAGSEAQVTNPSFEQGFKGWRRTRPDGPGQFAVDRKIAAKGQASCRIHVSKGGRLKLRGAVPVKPGQEYRVSFMYRTAKHPVGPRAYTSFRPTARVPGRRYALCYLGSPALPRTEGRWRKASFFVKEHPSGTRLVLEFNVHNGQTIWLDAFEVQPAEPGPGDRVYAHQPLPPRKPVYEEVLTDAERRYKVFPNWEYQTMWAGTMENRAIKFGKEAVFEAHLRELARHDFASFVNQRNMEMIKRIGMPVLGFVDNYREVVQKSRRKLDAKHRVPVTHPLVGKLMRDYVRSMHERWGDSLWGLFYIGEVYGRSTRSYRKFWKNKQQRTEVNRQVRSTTGNGRFGLPRAEGGEQPFRWIAYRRWMDDQLFNLFRSIRKTATEADPGVVLIGPNERNGGAPRDWERLARTWDITSGQGLAFWNPVHKHAVGFITKLMRDLSFKPTMPFAQVSAYAHASTVAYTREQYDQALRNGAVGFWINSVEWKDRELQHPMFSAPRRWQAMLALADTVRKTPVLDYPSADTAILYSVDANQANPASGQMATESAATHVFLGPEVGSWFHFISEYQIERGSRDLENYNIIYIPSARYIRRSVVERLVQYVKNGGKLVCLDPTAFEKTDYGKDLTDLKKRLLGVSAGEQSEPLKLRLAATKERLGLPTGLYPLFGTSTAIQVVDPQNSRVLMRFDDDSPAAVFHRLGEGATLTLAYNPARSTTIDQKIWRDFFDALQQWAGCQRDLAIWRFRLPLDLPARGIDPPAGLVCLTNNHVVMSNNVVTTPRNLRIDGGGYRYPTAPAEEGKADELIPLDEGKLTNRRAAFDSIRDLLRSKKGRSEKGMDPRDWSISWPASKKQPLVLDIVLDQSRPLRAIRLWVSGPLPAVTIQANREASGGSKEFETVGRINPDSSNTGTGVQRLGTDLDVNARVLRLKLDPPNDAGRDLVLAEVELWGPDDATTQARKP